MEQMWIGEKFYTVDIVQWSTGKWIGWAVDGSGREIAKVVGDDSLSVYSGLECALGR